MTRMTDMADLACDRCGWWEAGTEPQTSKQRAILKRYGWTTSYTSGRLEDVCPTCSKQVPSEIAR